MTKTERKIIDTTLEDLDSGRGTYTCLALIRASYEVAGLNYSEAENSPLVLAYKRFIKDDLAYDTEVLNMWGSLPVPKEERQAIRIMHLLLFKAVYTGKKLYV